MASDTAKAAMQNAMAAGVAAFGAGSGGKPAPRSAAAEKIRKAAGAKMRRAIVKLAAAGEFKKIPGRVLTAGEYDELHPSPGPGEYTVKDARNITYEGGVPFQGKGIKRELQEVDQTYKAMLKTPGPQQYEPRALKRGGSYVFSQSSRDTETWKIYHGPGSGLYALDSPGPGSYASGNWSSFKGVNPNGPPHSFGATSHEISYETDSPGPLGYNVEKPPEYSPKFGFGASMRGENNKTFPGEEFMSKGTMGPQLLDPFTSFGPRSPVGGPAFTFLGHRTERKMPKRYDKSGGDEGKEGKDSGPESGSGAAAAAKGKAGSKLTPRQQQMKKRREEMAAKREADKKAASERPKTSQGLKTKKSQKELARDKDYSWLHYDGGESGGGGGSKANLDGLDLKTKQLARPPTVHFGSAPRFNVKEYVAHKPDVGRLYTDGPGPAYAPKSDMGSGPRVPFTSSMKLAPTPHELSTRDNPGPGQYQLLLEHRLEEERLLGMVADELAGGGAAHQHEVHSALQLEDVEEVRSYHDSDEEREEPEADDAGAERKVPEGGRPMTAPTAASGAAAGSLRPSPVKATRTPRGAGGGGGARAGAGAGAAGAGAAGGGHPQSSPIKRGMSRGGASASSKGSMRRPGTTPGHRRTRTGSSLSRTMSSRHAPTPSKPMNRTATFSKLTTPAAQAAQSPSMKRVKTIGQLLRMQNQTEQHDKMAAWKEATAKRKAEAAKLAAEAAARGERAVTSRPGASNAPSGASSGIAPAIAEKRGPPEPLVSRHELLEHREKDYFPATKDPGSSKFSGNLPRTPSMRFSFETRETGFYGRYHGPGNGIMALHSPGPGIYDLADSSFKAANPNGPPHTFGATSHEIKYDTAGPGPLGYDVKFPKKYSPAFGMGVSQRGENDRTYGGHEAFMSKGKLGPGMYQVHTDLDKIIRGGVLSTSRRQLGEIPMHKKAIPGPGAYDPK